MNPRQVYPNLPRKSGETLSSRIILHKNFGFTQIVDNIKNNNKFVNPDGVSEIFFILIFVDGSDADQSDATLTAELCGNFPLVSYTSVTTAHASLQ